MFFKLALIYCVKCMILIFLNSFFDLFFSLASTGAAPGALLYVFLLSRLTEQYRFKLRDLLVPAILKFLTIKRPIESDRREFFAYAEAFASLVKLEFVSITGAVTTITTLLQQPDTRCAAVTMLGKTVELCLTQLAAKSDPTQLSAMRAALANVTDDAFQVSFIVLIIYLLII